MIQRKKLNPAIKIVLGFLSVILIGSFFLCLPISSNDGQWFSFLDSLLTSTSAVCVTGLIVVDTAVHFSLFGQIVIMILIQIGGLGFITLASLLFLMIGKKITYEKRIAMQESLNQDSVQGIVKLVKNIVILVFFIEFVGALLLAPSLIPIYGWGQGIFKAIFLSISAFCNAGFDPLGTPTTQFGNLAVFADNSLILIPIMLLIITGGIGYLVLFSIGSTFKKEKLSFHAKVVINITLVLIFGGAFIFGLLEWNNPETIGNLGVWDKIVNCLFQSVTPRTAGFATFDQSKLTQGSILLTDILMFIGGSPASTAGGIKTTTLFILLLAIFKPENTNGNIAFCKKRISGKVIKKAVRIVLLTFIFVLIGVFSICVFEGGAVTTQQAFFECISAISTVGLSLGITPFLSIGSKIIVTILMFAGRVGAMTLTFAFINKKTNIAQDIEFPDSKIIIG